MILYGKPVSAEIDNLLISRIQELNSRGIQVILAVVRIGNNPDDISMRLVS